MKLRFMDQKMLFMLVMLVLFNLLFLEASSKGNFNLKKKLVKTNVEFNNVNLETVIKHLEKETGIRFEIEKSLLKEKITIVIRKKDNLKYLLELLKVYDIYYKIDKNKIVLSKVNYTKGNKRRFMSIPKLSLRSKKVKLASNYNTKSESKIRVIGDKSFSDSTSIYKESEMIMPNPMPHIHIPNTEVFNTEEYTRIYERGFLSPVESPLSTFSIDVDTASYSNMRRYINSSQTPPKDSIRIEELINYFKYDYDEVDKKNEHPFNIINEVTQCPWNKDNQLALIALKAKNIDREKMPQNNLVFLIDVSGSMGTSNKLPLLKKSMKLLVNQMREEDRISIVVYAGAAGLALDSTSGKDKLEIMEAIDKLNSGGSTAGGRGIKLAYKVAKENFIKEGNNRIILATDGDFNVGTSNTADLTRLIEEKRDEGVFLSILGFGTGNYKDSRMEELSNKGNGNYAYIDNLMEGKKVLVDQFSGTILTVAKDVKLQVEFNPSFVKKYRLIGYVNRRLNKEDFDDDKKDAGELGAGHTVTALYEIIPNYDNKKVTSNLKYQAINIDIKSKNPEIMNIKFRYKEPNEDKSKLFEKVVYNNDIKSFYNSSNNIKFASSVAAFGMLLRDSKYKGNINLDEIIKNSKASKGNDDEGYRAEFIRLMEMYKLNK